MQHHLLRRMFKSDQILKYRFYFAIMREILPELLPFISIRYAICFK